MADFYSNRLHRSGGIHHIDLSTIADTSEALRTTLDQMGITINPSSRIAIIIRDMEALARFLRGEDKSLKEPKALVTSLLEFNQFELIARHLRGKAEDAGIHELSRRFLQDNCSPYLGRETPGRDSQFELYFLAMCRRAGFHITRKEPDFMITPVLPKPGEFDRVLVAVKRVRSQGQLVRRISEGGYQLAKQGGGIVVVDITQLLNREDHFYPVESNDTAIDQAAGVFDAFVADQMAPLARKIKPNDVFAVVFHGAIYAMREVVPGVRLPMPIERTFTVPVSDQYRVASTSFGYKLVFP